MHTSAASRLEAALFPAIQTFASLYNNMFRLVYLRKFYANGFPIQKERFL